MNTGLSTRLFSERPSDKLHFKLTGRERKILRPFMTDLELEQMIAKLATKAPGHVGICAETLDGNRCITLNADDVFPAASSIKIYVLFTLLVKANANQLSLADRIEFTPTSAKPGSGVLSHLDPGLRPSLKDLATLMMMISDNSALAMLVDYLGIDDINAEISRLGLEHTCIGDWSNFKETYADSLSLSAGTPREFVSFLLRMRRGELLTETLQETFWDILRIQKYIEPLRRFLPASPWAREFDMPEPVWVASKSGTLDDCVTESGFIKIHSGGWAISIMTRDLPAVSSDPHNSCESLIADISLQVYDSWAPHYE
jgi:beta-lactamase class A